MVRRSRRDWLYHQEHSGEVRSPREYAERFWLLNLIAQYDQGGEPSIPSEQSTESGFDKLEDLEVDHEGSPSTKPANIPQEANDQPPQSSNNQSIGDLDDDSESALPSSDRTNTHSRYLTLESLLASPAISALEVARAFKETTLSVPRRSAPELDVAGTLKHMSPHLNGMSVKLKYPSRRCSRLLVVEDRALSMIPWRGEAERLAQFAQMYGGFERVYPVIQCDFNQADELTLVRELRALDLPAAEHLLVLIVSDAVGRHVTSGSVTEALLDLPDRAQVVWSSPYGSHGLVRTPLWSRSYKVDPHPVQAGYDVSPLFLTLTPEGLSPLSAYCPSGRLTRRRAMEMSSDLINSGERAILGFHLPRFDPDWVIEPPTQGAVEIDEDDLDDLCDALLRLRGSQPWLFQHLQMIALLPGEVLGLDLLLTLSEHFHPRQDARARRVNLAAVLTSGFLRRVSESSDPSDLQVGFVHEAFPTLLRERATHLMRDEVTRFLLTYSQELDGKQLQTLNPVLQLLIRHHQTTSLVELYGLNHELSQLSKRHRDHLVEHFELPSVSINYDKYLAWRGLLDEPEVAWTPNDELEQPKQVTLDPDLKPLKAVIYHPLFADPIRAIKDLFDDHEFLDNLSQGVAHLKLPRDQYLDACAEIIPTYLYAWWDEVGDDYFTEDQIDDLFELNWVSASCFTISDYYHISGTPMGNVHVIELLQWNRIDRIINYSPYDPEIVIFKALAIWNGHSRHNVSSTFEKVQDDHLSLIKPYAGITAVDVLIQTKYSQYEDILLGIDAMNVKAFLPIFDTVRNEINYGNGITDSILKKEFLRVIDLISLTESDRFEYSLEILSRLDEDRLPTLLLFIKQIILLKSYVTGFFIKYRLSVNEACELLIRILALMITKKGVLKLLFEQNVLNRVFDQYLLYRKSQLSSQGELILNVPSFLENADLEDDRFWWTHEYLESVVRSTISESLGKYLDQLSNIDISEIETTNDFESDLIDWEDNPSTALTHDRVETLLLQVLNKQINLKHIRLRPSWLGGIIHNKLKDYNFSAGFQRSDHAELLDFYSDNQLIELTTITKKDHVDMPLNRFRLDMINQFIRSSEDDIQWFPCFTSIKEANDKIGKAVLHSIKNPDRRLTPLKYKQFKYGESSIYEYQFEYIKLIVASILNILPPLSGHDTYHVIINLRGEEPDVDIYPRYLNSAPTRARSFINQLRVLIHKDASKPRLKVFLGESIIGVISIRKDGQLKLTCKVEHIKEWSLAYAQG